MVGAGTIAVLASLCAAVPAAADTFHVSNTNDPGPGSLRQAMIQANAHPAHDTIVFDTGVTGTIKLAQGELSVQSDMEIQGPGVQALTISGNNNIRVFNIAGQPRGSARISNLTIANGTAYGPSGSTAQNGGSIGGGVIYNLGTLSLDSVQVSGGLALAGSGGNGVCGDSGGSGGNAFGGGIFNGPGASLALSHTLVAGNTAQGGFGGDAPARCILGGHAGEGGTGWGGGIWNQGALTIIDSRVAGGQAAGGEGGNDRYGDSRGRRGGEGNGGGIASVSDQEVSITGTSLDANTARGGPGPWGGNAAGGGILANGAEIVDSTISDNAVRGGAGDHNEKRGQTAFGGGLRGTGVVFLQSSTVRSNTVRGGDRHDPDTSVIAGGGLSSAGDSDLFAQLLTLSGNSAAVGGGIDNRDGSRARIAASTIADNEATAVTATAGANLANTDATFRLANTLVANPLGGPPSCGNRTITSDGFNLDDGSSCGFSKPTDLTATNPMLADLKDNGGPTRTRALPASSPAIDQGTSLGFTTDQRGSTRPVSFGRPRPPGGDGTDIGAYELQRGTSGEPTCDGLDATIIAGPLTRGTNRADVIAGTVDPNDVHGLHGDDWICGNRGEDRLAGGRGADRLHGGDGDDRIQDLHGRNVITCGKGFDLVLTKRRTSVASNCERVRRR
ncbi:MAG TPA: choice-of-anchor Q domain-containing protein [Solirubrobacterales bacterium]